MNDICVTLITVDRGLRGKRNYLSETLSNLKRGGLWNSFRFHSFHLVDSGSSLRWIEDQTKKARIEYNRCIVYSGHRIACENAGKALMIGGLSGAKWVLFLEDDIDVCSDFLDSVGLWLDQHGNDEQYRLFAFGAAYDQTLQNYQRGMTAWEYPVKSFYGTQCFAIRPKEALGLADYISSNPQIGGVRNPNAYDLMFQDYFINKYLNPKFLASCPSFVEHTGRESICTGKDETHRFMSWQGRDWSYTEGSARIAA